MSEINLMKHYITSFLLGNFKLKIKKELTLIV